MYKCLDNDFYNKMFTMKFNIEEVNEAMQKLGYEKLGHSMIGKRDLGNQRVITGELPLGVFANTTILYKKVGMDLVMQVNWQMDDFCKPMAKDQWMIIAYVGYDHESSDTRERTSDTPHPEWVHHYYTNPFTAHFEADDFQIEAFEEVMTEIDEFYTSFDLSNDKFSGKTVWLGHVCPSTRITKFAPAVRGLNDIFWRRMKIDIDEFFNEFNNFNPK